MLPIMRWPLTSCAEGIRLQRVPARLRTHHGRRRRTPGTQRASPSVSHASSPLRRAQRYRWVGLAQGFCQWNAHEHRLVVSRAKTAASPTPSVTRAHDAAVIRDDAAAVAVDEAEDELFGGLVDERLLPGLQSNRSHVLLAGPCWAGFRCGSGPRSAPGAIAS